MTTEELKKVLETLGIKTDPITDELAAKAQAWLDDQKATMDTETRRKLRVFWGTVSVVALVVGVGLGYWLSNSPSLA